MFSAFKTREEKQEGGKELKKKVAMKEQLRMPIQKKDDVYSEGNRRNSN